jgi:hypothetical protein
MAAQTNRIQRPANWQARPARETLPPKFLWKVGNFFMKRMLGGKMGDVIMLITFTGRKSGKTFTTPIGYTRQGNTLTSFCDSPWQKNLVGGAPVTVTIKGQAVLGLATTISDHDQVAAYVKYQLQNGGPQAARQMALALPKGYLPTDEELRIMLRDRVLITTQLPDSK